MTTEGLPEVEGFVASTWGAVNTADDVIAHGRRYHVVSAGPDPTSKLKRLVVMEPEGGGEPEVGSPECRIPVLVQDRVTPAAKEAGVEVSDMALAVLSVYFPDMFESTPLCQVCGVLVVKGYSEAHEAEHKLVAQLAGGAS